MPKAILNYTTSIDPKKTINQITDALADHGASRTMIEYSGERKPTGLAFTIETVHGERAFRLPARIEGVEAALQRAYKRRQVERRMTSREHAERVAWRVLKDWVDVQMAFVDAGLASIDEVMLPFLVVKGQQTMYQVISNSRLALPAPDGVDDE